MSPWSFKNRGFNGEGIMTFSGFTSVSPSLRRRSAGLRSSSLVMIALMPALTQSLYSLKTPTARETFILFHYPATTKNNACKLT